MPLLKRKAFEKSSVAEYLKDDDEVFHCEITGEIFSDYEEYCERIILVNSMVWSCEMTGKPNLTYAEALQSERNAKKSLKDFPIELRVPILYLASRTKRCTFAEMLDDVFNFVRDRYFVGETIEACLDGESWSEAHILSVTAPKHANNESPTSSSSPLKPSSFYSYEVEQFPEEDEEGEGECATVTHERVRRCRGVFTRDKNKLYLKQFVEQGPNGIIRIKESAIEKYNIPKVKFDQIFVGDPPVFPSSKKLDKVTTAKPKAKVTPDKKPRQETMAKYITKVDTFQGTKPSKTMVNNKQASASKPQSSVSNGKALKEEMKRLGEEAKQKKIEEKQKKKEKSQKLAAYVKEWNKQKDDLELVDHKPLPAAIPIQIPGIPNRYFGDFMSILEFLKVFGRCVRAQSGALEAEGLRRALTAREVAGPLAELLQALLTAIFTLQEDEAEEYNGDGEIQDVQDMVHNSEALGVTVTRGIQLATAASKWPQTYLATPLSQLPMDSQTFSEVLRLHLLSSGSEGGEHCIKWRYQQRGGYNSQDDPGLLLRIQKPNIIRALARKHITQLPMSYKLKIIHCLINQILSYASVRDVIEEKLEKLKNLKIEIKNLQLSEKKREAEVILSRQKVYRDAAAKKEAEKLEGEQAAAVDAAIPAQLEALAKENLQKKAEFEKKFRNMQRECFIYQSYLGSDRAHRRYWVYEAVPGLFIEHDDRFNGICHDKPVIPNPALVGAPPEDTLHYVQNLFETEYGGNSDKENDSENPQKSDKSPKKSTTCEAASSPTQLMQDLLMCTASPLTCPVHPSSVPKTRWAFLHTREHVDSLIEALNKRGVREADLRQTLEQEKEQIVEYIERCNGSQLNPDVFPSVGRTEIQTRLTRKYVDANLRFPPEVETSHVLEMTLRDTVLDLEEKIFLGCLGELAIKDRNAWRTSILNKGYEKQCNKLIWGPNRSLTDDLQIINGKTKTDASAEAIIAAYRDPGCFLVGGDTVPAEPESEEEEEQGETSGDELQVVKSLASALLQLEQAVHQKYLKRPLGYDEKERSKDPKAILDFDALKRWEVSLMECTSFAQVTLHLLILENSIVWSKSVLNANCRLCRKRSDPENMLLCDSCNKGHHMYCLKPKLTKVPEGDWFCDLCKPKEKTPQKKNRKVFKEEEESGNEMEEETASNWSEDDVSVSVCAVCGSGGSLVACSVCSEGWHEECLPRPLRNKASFVCSPCANNQHRDSDSSDERTTSRSRKKRTKEASPSPEKKSNGVSHKKSRRSVTLNFGIKNNSESSDDQPLRETTKRKRLSKESPPKTNGVTNGTKKSTRNSSRHSAPSSFLNGFVRRSRKSELIHQSALEELLEDVMRHKDSWPFNAPVTVEEVPDYFKIISDPMDFGTIQSKLKRTAYKSDADFMADAALVFENCFAYNENDAAVAKAGVRLHKFFEKQCKSLNLVGLPNIEPSDPEPPPTKKSKKSL